MPEWHSRIFKNHIRSPRCHLISFEQRGAAKVPDRGRFIVSSRRGSNHLLPWSGRCEFHPTAGCDRWVLGGSALVRLNSGIHRTQPQERKRPRGLAPGPRSPPRVTYLKWPSHEVRFGRRLCLDTTAQLHQQLKSQARQNREDYECWRGFPGAQDLLKLTRYRAPACAQIRIFGYRIGEPGGSPASKPNHHQSSKRESLVTRVRRRGIWAAATLSVISRFPGFD